MRNQAYFDEKTQLHFNERVRFMTHEQAERAMCALIRSHLKTSLVTKPTECSVIIEIKRAHNLGATVGAEAYATSQRLLKQRTTKACYKQSVIDNIGRSHDLSWDESADPFKRRGSNGGAIKVTKKIAEKVSMKPWEIQMPKSECGVRTDGTVARIQRNDIKVVARPDGTEVEYERVMGRWVAV